MYDLLRLWKMQKKMMTVQIIVGEYEDNIKNNRQENKESSMLIRLVAKMVYLFGRDKILR